jgi:long-chain fatty acid transport protein
VARFSGEHGHPTTDNPTALYFNPAALRATRPELFVDGLFGYRRMRYVREARPSDAPDVAGAEGANVGRATLDDWLASPSLWFALPVSERFALAAGIFTPLGGPISWDERGEMASSPFPGPVDGVTRFHAIEGLSITTYGSLGASYAVSPSLRFGLALSAIYTRIEDVRAWSGGSNGAGGEGRSLLEVDGLAWGFGAGVYYETPDKTWSFGLSYQSRPNVAGGVELEGRLSNNIGGPSGANAELHEDLPDIARLGVAYRPRPELELRVFGAWERWSAFERQCIVQAGAACRIDADGGQPDGGGVLQNVPRHFRDAIDARLGLSIWTSPRLEFFSGIGAMSEAVPDSTLEASLPDFFALTFSLGTKYGLSDAVSVAGSLSHLVSPPRSAQSTLQNRELPSRLPDASGHYAQSISYADVNVSLRF